MVKNIFFIEAGMLKTAFFLLSLVFSHSCLSQAVAHPEFRGFLVDMSRLSPEQRKALTPSYIEQLTSSPPSFDDCRLRGKDGDSYGAQANAA